MNITFLLQYEEAGSCALTALFSCKQHNSVLCSDTNRVLGPCRALYCVHQEGILIFRAFYGFFVLIFCCCIVPLISSLFLFFFTHRDVGSWSSGWTGLCRCGPCRSDRSPLSCVNKTSALFAQRSACDTSEPFTAITPAQASHTWNQIISYLTPGLLQPIWAERLCLLLLLNLSSPELNHQHAYWFHLRCFSSISVTPNFLCSLCSGLSLTVSFHFFHTCLSLSLITGACGFHQLFGNNVAPVSQLQGELIAALGSRDVVSIQTQWCRLSTLQHAAMLQWRHSFLRPIKWVLQRIETHSQTTGWCLCGVSRDYISLLWTGNKVGVKGKELRINLSLLRIFFLLIIP